MNNYDIKVTGLVEAPGVRSATDIARDLLDMTKKCHEILQAIQQPDMPVGVEKEPPYGLLGALAAARDSLEAMLARLVDLQKQVGRL